MLVFKSLTWACISIDRVPVTECGSVWSVLNIGLIRNSEVDAMVGR